MSQDKELEIRLQFLEEAQEYLNIIEYSVLELATAYSDNQMDAVLRAAHSIKGGAAMMGFITLSNLAHRFEDFFKVLKTQKSSLDVELESLLLNGIDDLRQVTVLCYQGVAAHDDTTLIADQWLERVNRVFEQLHQRLGDPTEVDTVVLSPEDGQDMVALIFESEVEERLQHLHSILVNPEQPCLLVEISDIAEEFAGLGQMLQLNAFTTLSESITQKLKAHPERVAEIADLAFQQWRRSQAAVLVGQVSTLPQQIDLDTGKLPKDASVTAAADHELVQSIPEVKHNGDIQSTASETVDLLANSSELKLELTPTVQNFQENSENTVRVPIKLLDQLSDLFGELTIERTGLNLYIERMRNLVRVLRHRVQSLKREDALHQETSYNQSNSLEINNHNNHHALFAEVIENINRIQEVTDDIDLTLEETEQTVGNLNRTAKQLQTSLTQVRMRPLSDLVGRFPRFLHKLSQQYGKKVDLKLDGEGILIDRSVLEALKDPLIHLLRNAFAHGIEDPVTRQSSGKPQQGVIEIRAAYRGNQTQITVSDDGGGIEIDRIRHSAARLGLDVAALAAASEQELLDLIFAPGFSTANEVTTLSGRGVGLDVVRTNLRKIRGDIKVDTQPGLGTTFTLSVPLTLSVARVLLVESKGMLMAFPSDVIEEMLLLHSEQISTVAAQEFINWRSTKLPLIRLEQWLEFKRPYKKVNNDATPITSVPTVLTIAQGKEWVGIQVDRCWGEQEVAIRQVEGTPTMPPGFAGCTILGDGRVVPLVNASELLHWIASTQQSSKSKLEIIPKPTSYQNQKDTILVVDDSINVRRFLSLTLEKAGYRVEQAEDGQDALEKLLSELPIDAVICDVDMPRLDGYGLLARVKSNPALENLPITMLTSRSGDKDRQLAMSLGATAYFSKPYNEQELLQTLQKLLQN